MHKIGSVRRSWLKAPVLAGLLIYFYIFMEWIFFATKPSFMSSMDLAQKVLVFFTCSFALVVPALILAGFSGILAKWLKVTWLAATIPAMVVALLSLILFDNFTYTVFKFGIVTSAGIWRGIYAAGLLVVFGAFLKKILAYSDGWSHQQLCPWLMVLLFISTLAFIAEIPRSRISDLGGNDSTIESAAMPDIILLGLDGVNATHMSVYGYERDTTPHLTALAQNALFIENAFSNAGKTGGSLTSLLTGKSPTNTRVIFPPDILLGEDAYQHLPGILRQLGYSTVQITMPDYGDAYERNIQDGFDIVNFRSTHSSPLLDRFARLGGTGGLYFTGQVIVRISERLGHIFFIKPMIDPYEIVTRPVDSIHDDQRLQAMIDYLDEADRPIFLHVHLMDMHGPTFYVPKQHFSAGQTQDEEWIMDFYDDAILGSDGHIRELFDHLSETGRMENTVVILYSDHGMEWDPLDRVPLMLWFPHNEFAGALRENVQLMDISPTLLDYLDVPQPEWMEGRSILTHDLPVTQRIFSANVGDEMMLNEEQSWIVDASRISPPFYQLGSLNLIVCNTWFSMDLREPRLTYGDIEGSTAVCDAAEIPSPLEAEKLLVQHLIDQNYDVTTLPLVIPMKEVLR
jgi:arylsulfatase A-like enzyme